MRMQIASLAARDRPRAERSFRRRHAASGDIVVSARLGKTARSEQQAAPNLINIRLAEAIAKYPYVNAAEALGRIPAQPPLCG